MMNKVESSYKFLIAIFIIVALMCNCVLSTPMLYKRNPDDKYERDLVPVSSTVVPLTALEVSYGLGGKPSEEYKEAYLKKLRKKVQHERSQGDVNEDPDTLITKSVVYGTTAEFVESAKEKISFYAMETNVPNKNSTNTVVKLKQLIFSTTVILSAASFLLFLT